MVGPAPALAPFATPGVVGVEGGLAADWMGIKPGMPPNAPAKSREGLAIGRTSVLVSELADPGRAASDVGEALVEAPAELSDTGAPTIGTAVGSELLWGVSEEGRGASEADVEALEETAVESELLWGASEEGRGASEAEVEASEETAGGGGTTSG